MKKLIVVLLTVLGMSQGTQAMIPDAIRTRANELFEVQYPAPINSNDEGTIQFLQHKRNRDFQKYLKQAQAEAAQQGIADRIYDATAHVVNTAVNALTPHATAALSGAQDLANRAANAAIEQTTATGNVIAARTQELARAAADAVIAQAIETSNDVSERTQELARAAADAVIAQAIATGNTIATGAQDLARATTDTAIDTGSAIANRTQELARAAANAATEQAVNAGDIVADHIQKLARAAAERVINAANVAEDAAHAAIYGGQEPEGNQLPFFNEEFDNADEELQEKQTTGSEKQSAVPAQPFFKLENTTTNRALLVAAIPTTIIALIQARNYLKADGPDLLANATQATKNQIVAPFTWTLGKLQDPSKIEKSKGFVVIAASLLAATEVICYVGGYNSPTYQAYNAAEKAYNDYNNPTPA